MSSLEEIQLNICHDQLRQCNPELLKQVDRAPKKQQVALCRQLLNKCRREKMSTPVQTTEGMKVFTPAGQLVALTGNIKGYQHLRKAKGKKSRKNKKRGHKKRRKTLYKKKGKKMQKRRGKTKRKSKKGGGIFTRNRYMRPRPSKYGKFKTRRTQEQLEQLKQEQLEQLKHMEMCNRLEREKQFEPQEGILRFQQEYIDEVTPHEEKLKEGFHWYSPSGICGRGYYTNKALDMNHTDETVNMNK